jgi:glycosyltransferase involved in cell wall biosynthesis
MSTPIKLLCLMEATTVTGPAKNLLNFCRLMRSPEFATHGAPPVEVAIVTFDRARDDADNGNNQCAPNAFVAAARGAGIAIEVIPERFRFDTRVIAALREIVDRRAPDIVQTHMVKSHFLFKLAGLGKKYPWIAYHHGYTTTNLKMQFYNQLNRWTLPSANVVITVCEDFAKQLSRAGVRKSRIVVNHNSVDAPRNVTSEERQTLRDKLGIAADERILVAVGRLSKEKGHAELLESIAILREANASLKFKLLIVGEGPEQAGLQSTVEARALTSNVIFVGQVDDIAPFYAITDVLALPSHSEGSPNVLLEGMAAGLPVVATRVGGVPEIVVPEESALVVPARDPQQFAAALHRVLTQPEFARTLSANAMARVADFSSEAYALSLIRVYHRLMPASVGKGEHQPVSA